MGYFAEVYFNCSMDWSDLESVIGDFLMREDKQTIEAFQNEVEILHMFALEDTMPIENIAGILTGRGTPKQGAESVLKLFYKSVQKIKFRNICYFLNCYFGCYIGLFELQSRIEDFLMWENVKALEKEMDIKYKLDDPEIMREAAHVENRIETYLMEGNKERVGAFRKEIEAVYTLTGNPKFMKEAAHRLGGDIRIPDKKAVCVIKLLYDYIKKVK